MATTGRKRVGRPKRKRKRGVLPEDLLRFHFVSDPQIAPDGRIVLFTKKHVGQKNDYLTNLWVVPADAGEPAQFTSGGKDRHGRWSPDGRIIAFISERDEAKPQIYAMAATGGEATPLSRFPEGRVKSFKWSPDGKRLAVSFRETDPDWTEEAKKKREENGQSTPPYVIDDLYYRLDGDGYFNAKRFQLYVVDADTGEHRRVFDRDTVGWFSYDWSPDSRELVVSANTSRDGLLKLWKIDLYRVDVESGKARKVPNLPLGVKNSVAWSPDGSRIAYAGREGKEIWGVRNTRLFTCSPDGGDVRELTGTEDHCLSATTISDMADSSFEERFIWSPDGKRILLNFGTRGEMHVASVGAAGGSIDFHTQGRRTVIAGNVSADGRRMALLVSDQLRPAEAAAGRFSKKAASGSLRIGKPTEFNKPVLDELELSAAEPHWVETPEGTKVHAWVMKPPNFKRRKKYPAVLEIHGGPHTQYGETFFHEFQVLAAAGYVVVYSNPRGSKGYGENHCLAIKGKWGQADWQDIQAVTAFMKERPYVDEKRMGVMGGSYGGYMTNWVVGHTNDFAAAITDRCVSNLVSMVGSSDIPLVPGDYWEGNSWDNSEEIWEQSPLRHFGNVRTPTLVIHSEGDLRCNVEQGEQVFAALQLRGIPTRFIRYPSNTSHGLSRSGPPDLRLHRLRQILQWWRHNLG